MGNGGKPVDVKRARSNIENYGDPYITSVRPEEIRICSVCGAIFSGQRWYLKSQVDPDKLKDQQVRYTVCPACHKIRDRSPGGIVQLMGKFLIIHKQDILNLIRKEGERAMAINPLERIIDIEGEGSTYDVTTTNEKLAQKIGRALHKAYDGEIIYKWSENNKLLRVIWRREQ
ncbi:MAG: BCAM0308 family protein [Armatimonadota bacterium]